MMGNKNALFLLVEYSSMNNFPSVRQQVTRPRPDVILPGIRHLNLCDIKEGEYLGRGAFAQVYKCKIQDDNTIFALKKVQIQMDEDAQLFEKEVRLLTPLEHENIIRIHAVCLDNYAMVLDCLVFDFNPFGFNKKVSSLNELLCNIHHKYNFNSFEKLPLYISHGIAKGIEYLHKNDIVHRDLKPGNILVSNQHYASLKIETIQDMWMHDPVHVKLSDFGESRSQIEQTCTPKYPTHNGTSSANFLVEHFKKMILILV